MRAVRPLAELLSGDPAWPEVRTWVSRSRRSVEVLPTERPRAEAVLLALQVSTRTPIGAVALETGGLVIDRWLRVLGGGGPRMAGDLARWNGLGAHPILPRQSGLRIVGHDVIGGFFAIDRGGLGDTLGEMHYYAPDSLAWEGIDQSYSEWLHGMLDDDMNNFYAENRWKGWEREAAETGFDDGIAIEPGLWTDEGRPIEKTSRKAVSMPALWALEQEASRHLDRSQEGDGDEDDDDE